MVFIRKLKKSELKKFQDIFKTSVTNGFPEYSQRIIKFFTSSKYVKEMFQLPLKIGAYENNQLIGFILANTYGGGVLYIHWLAVLKDFRRKGIGTMLLDAIEKESLKKGFHNIQFHTDKRNLGFYKKRGFEIVGLDRKSYFGIDEYVVKKLIQEPHEAAFFKQA